jgi:hypothetical protein
MKTWWREGMDVGFQLMSISRKMEKLDWDLKERGDQLWDVRGFKWKLYWKDVNGSGDYIEEQIWAMRKGYA